MPMTRYVYRRVVKRGTINNNMVSLPDPTTEELYEPLQLTTEIKKSFKALLLLLLMAGTLLAGYETLYHFNDQSVAGRDAWDAYSEGGPYPYEDNPEDDPLYKPEEAAKYGNEGK